MIRVAAAMMALLVCGVTTAATINVAADGSGDYTTIQAAVDAASNGDVILVAPGTYTGTDDEVVNTLGKAITIKASGTPEETILDGEGARRVVECSSGEGADAVIEGFTITGGSANSSWPGGYGGGIFCFEFSSPTITNCTISSNAASDGGGIYCGWGSPTITGCTITDNTASYGGGIFTFFSTTISGCTISNNTSDYGGGIYCWGSTTLTDTVVCENAPDNIYGPWTDGGGGCIAYSCQDSDGNGVPDKCDGSIGDGIHEVPSEYATVQEAINAAGYGDTVLVAPGTYTGTGDWVINTGGKPITILATGTTEETILDGEGARLVVQCAGGEGAGTIIEGFTITGGYNWYGGGGIACEGSSPTISGCTITGNDGGGFFGGGGIYCINSNPTITGCIISDNTADDGGGICNRGYSNPTLIDTVLCENAPDNIYGSWTDGGGACLAYSCQDSDGNGVPDKCDGSIGDDIHEVPSEYATVQGAINAARYGDMVLVAPGTYTGTGDWVINPIGKTITILATGTPGETILDGEGVRCVVRCSSGEGADTIIEGFTITGGSADYGGGIYCYGSSPTITGCMISGNTATGEGAGIYCSNSSPTISGCTISGNTASAGGGIYCGGGSPTISGCTITGNTATSDNVSAFGGGGILCSKVSSPTITGCTISNNHATDLNGGGISCSDASSPTISGCIISGNTAVEGGGICCSSSSSTISGCTISNNTAEWGGGIHCSYYYGGEVDPTITDCIISGNAASGTYGDGGGIYCHDSTAPTISGCTISGNTATDDGGGIYCYWNSSPTLDGCTISDNTADIDGGGIYCYSSSNPTLTDTVVCNNDPDQISGNWTDNGGNTVSGECPICADVDGDGFVAVHDLLAVLEAWSSDDPDADVDGDGIVGMDDLTAVIDAWGPCE
jgi:parallel beta-helix repeat protein